MCHEWTTRPTPGRQPPEHVRALVLVNAYARVVKDHDYPIGYPAEVVEQFVGDLTEPGTDTTTLTVSSGDPGVPDASATFPIWHPAWLRRSICLMVASSRPSGASVAASRGVWRVAIRTDLRAALPLINVPTLVLHSTRNAFVPVQWGRYLAEHIPNAEIVELNTADHVPWASNSDIAGEIEEFLTGTRQLAPSSRMLATVLFTDIVGSTDHAQRPQGMDLWKELLESHDHAVERQIRRYGGRLVEADR